MLVSVLVLAACGASSSGTQSPPDSESRHDDGPTSSDARGTLPDAHDQVDAATRHHDAAIDARPLPIDATPLPIDASIPPSIDAGGGVSGTVSCYTSGQPSATCTLPVHCCFTNYSSQHDGSCSTSPCLWGAIDCDGPEDCPSGQRCCAHVISDPEDGILGYRLACQASACGAAPSNQELCHPTSSPAGTCSTGSACVTAFVNDPDLPRTLYICQ